MIPGGVPKEGFLWRESLVGGHLTSVPRRVPWGSSLRFHSWVSAVEDYVEGFSGGDALERSLEVGLWVRSRVRFPGVGGLEGLPSRVPW